MTLVRHGVLVALVAFALRLPAEAASGAAFSPAIAACDDSAGGCPQGYACQCVPSCPNCRDCVVRVCAPVSQPSCRTACDCPPGLGCFDGECIAGIAPVFCCDEPSCPPGEGCQHRDGRMDRCLPTCVAQTWSCAGGLDPVCGDDRVCACTASCPLCEDCGPGVCVPRGAPTPYRCSEDGSCAQSSDRCLCVASCPDCDDCAASVCVPACKSSCDLRREAVQGRLLAAVNASRRCTVDADCMKISTSTGCASSCLHSINRRYRKRLQRLQHTLDDRVCADYESDGCKRVITHCPGPPHRREPRCVEGMCR